MILHASKLDNSIKNTKWFKTVDSSGRVIKSINFKFPQFVNWVKNQAQEIKINLSNKSIETIAYFCEGNLPAAQQCLTKISYIPNSHNQIVEHTKVLNLLHDNRQLSHYSLIDFALNGDSKRCLATITAAKNAKTPPHIIIWLLHKELRSILLVKQNLSKSDNLSEIYKQLQIWPQRRAIVLKCARTIEQNVIQLCLDLIYKIELQSKGLNSFYPIWSIIQQVCLNLCSIQININK